MMAATAAMPPGAISFLAVQHIRHVLWAASSIAARGLAQLVERGIPAPVVYLYPTCIFHSENDAVVPSRVVRRLVDTPVIYSTYTPPRLLPGNPMESHADDSESDSDVGAGGARRSCRTWKIRDGPG